MRAHRLESARTVRLDLALCSRMLSGMKFQPGHDPRRNLTGRPRKRIVALRAKIGELTDDGASIVEALHRIIVDPESAKREVVEASALLLAYLVGKPESTTKISADITATARPALPASWDQMPLDERTAYLDAMRAAALAAAATPLLGAGDDEEAD